MKLESQKTMEFDAKELRKLARSTRPKVPWGWRRWAAAGAALGFALVAVIRLLPH